MGRYPIPQSKMNHLERLMYWTGRKTGVPECPYCGGRKTKSIDTKRGGKHFECLNKKCGAQNAFGKTTMEALNAC